MYVHIYIYIYIYIYVYKSITKKTFIIFISSYFRILYSFVRLTGNLKLYKKQKRSQLKYCQMVLYTIKNLLLIKGISKTLPSSSINNYIKVLQREHSRKTVLKEFGKME